MCFGLSENNDGEDADFFLYIPVSPNLADATYLMRLKEPSADEQKQWKEKPKMPFGV